MDGQDICARLKRSDERGDIEILESKGTWRRNELNVAIIEIEAQVQSTGPPTKLHATVERIQSTNEEIGDWRIRRARTSIDVARQRQRHARPARNVFECDLRMMKHTRGQIQGRF